jgi:nucleotide-binding universal stress UspA family protein
VARRSAERNGVPIKTIVAEGATAHAVLETARDEGCDLIVVGHTGRRGMQHMVLGSVAESIVHEADIPVMVIKRCSTEFCTPVRTDG